jgi:hypothetical protein
MFEHIDPDVIAMIIIAVGVGSAIVLGSVIIHIIQILIKKWGE